MLEQGKVVWNLFICSIGFCEVHALHAKRTEDEEEVDD